MKFFTHKLIIATLVFSTIGQAYAKGGEGRGERPERPTFASLDINEDGEITFDEFSQHEIPMGDHETIFEQIDSDGNSVIDEDEFNNHKPPRRN